MKISSTRRRLADISVQRLGSVQRQHGRALLPREFVAECVGHHDYAISLRHDSSTHGMVGQLSSFIADITYSIATFAKRPIDKSISYYPYTDLQVLDRFIKSSASDFRSRVRKAAEGAYLILLALYDFEQMSRNGREKNSRLSLVPNVVDERLLRLIEAIEACDSLVELVGGKPAELTICSKDQTTEEFALDPTQQAALIHFTGFPQSQFHDEIAFLRTIHVSEFCFIGLRFLADEARSHINAGDLPSVAGCFRDASAFAEVLHKAFFALRSMPPIHFAEFRDATGKSSAVQSVNYQEMDVALHGFNPFKTMICEDNLHLRHIRGFAHPDYRSLRQLLKQIDEQHEGLPAVLREAKRLDKKLTSWRGLHLMFAKLYLPSDAGGTGNTVGAPYLKHVLNWGLFDDTEPDYQLISAAFPGIDIDQVFRMNPVISIAPSEDSRQ